MVFHWRFSDSKSPQVSRTRLSILAILSNAVVWIVSTCLPTSKSSRPFNNSSVIVPKAPITIGTIVTFMFHSFFNSLARSRHLSLFHSFSFILWSAGTAKSTILQIFFFLLIIIIILIIIIYNYMSGYEFKMNLENSSSKFQVSSFSWEPTIITSCHGVLVSKLVFHIKYN